MVFKDIVLIVSWYKILSIMNLIIQFLSVHSFLITRSLRIYAFDDHFWVCGKSFGSPRGASQIYQRDE